MFAHTIKVFRKDEQENSNLQKHPNSRGNRSYSPRHKGANFPVLSQASDIVMAWSIRIKGQLCFSFSFSFIHLLDTTNEGSLQQETGGYCETPTTKLYEYIIKKLKIKWIFFFSINFK